MESIEQSLAPLRVLIVDKDQKFVDTIRSMLADRGGDNYQVDWESRSLDDIKASYDVFIICNMFTLSQDSLLQTIERIQKDHDSARIIVVGEGRDPRFLKRLINMNVARFFEKNADNIDQIFDDLEEERETVRRVLNIRSGILALDRAKEKMSQLLRPAV